MVSIEGKAPEQIVPKDINDDGTAMTSIGLMDVVESSFDFPFDDGMMFGTEIFMMAPLATDCPKCFSAKRDGVVFQTNHGEIVACRACNKFVKIVNEKNEGEEE
jgi:hypothetical protein